jgi:hypothetical protein
MHQKRISFLLAGIILMLPAFCNPIFAQLKVSDNQRFLVYEDGSPFFYLGDTAWELFHRLNREEADQYLQNRAEKGFTVIQAVALAQLGGLNDPNPYGHTPLRNNDPTRPNNDYFDHVDYIVNKANELGLIVGILPTWGSKWKEGRGEESGIFTPENARTYGQWLGERYRDADLIWILGGDENIQQQEEADIITAMAEGLREGDGGAHLITYHPRGPGLSSDFFHDAEWLDFNMFQSSHAARDHDNGLYTRNDYQLKPVKPTLDGEPRYEGIVVGFYFQDAQKDLRFDDYDARQAAYWSLLEGACGHTYGHNSIWQMWAPGRTPVLGAQSPWYEALDHAGSFQMRHVRNLFESRPYQTLEPRPDFLLDGPMSGGAKVKVARARDGSFAFVYSPRGEQFTIDQAMINSDEVRAYWYDPRYGTSSFIHEGDNTGPQTFTPPSSGRGQDWMLVLDDGTKNFPDPGKKE